ETKSTEPKPDEKSATEQATSPAGPVSPYVLRLQQALNEGQTDLKALKSEEQRLPACLPSYQTRVENVPRREQEFKELSRDYESTHELYQSLMKRHDEARLPQGQEEAPKSGAVR